MRTYYDGRQWITVLPDGRIRQATLGEALTANQGAGAPPGIAMPDYRITPENAQYLAKPGGTLTAQPDLAQQAGQTAQGNQATKETQKAAADKAAADQAAAEAAARQARQAAEASYAAALPRQYSDLYGRWLAGDQYNRSGQGTGRGNYFGGMGAPGGIPRGETTTNQDIYWNSAAGAHDAYNQAVAGVAEPDSYMARWLGNQFDQTYAQHNNAALTDTSRKWTDSLNEMMPGLVSRYFNLSGWQRGQNPGISFAGRRL